MKLTDSTGGIVDTEAHKTADERESWIYIQIITCTYVHRGDLQ